MNITCKEYAAHSLLPVHYHYENALLPFMDLERYLHLTGSGRLDVSAPFETSVSSGKGLFLLYVQNGSGRLTLDNAVHTVSSGSILLFDGSVPFRLRSVLLPWSFRLLWIDGADLQNYLPVLGRIFSATRQKAPAVASAIDELASFSGEVTLSALINMHRILINVLSDACLSCLPKEQPSAKIPSYLRDLYAYIHDCKNLTFSLAELEVLYGISRYRLCREYQAAFGTSPLKDFNQVRMNEAKKLLLNTDLQVQEVSSRLGYENTNHFIHLFKEKTGLPPKAFRLSSQTVKHTEPHHPL